MKLPFFAFVRGLSPPLTLFLARLIFREINMPGISWSDKGNVGATWQYLVQDGAGNQHLVAITFDHNTTYMDRDPVTADILDYPSNPMTSRQMRFFSRDPQKPQASGGDQ